MNADRVISKINYEMNTFNESGSREDKACAEGLRRARTYIQQEVLKRKILTHDQQVVLEELKTDQDGWDPFFTIWHLMEEKDSIHMPTKEQYQVLAAFAEWGLSTEEGDK